MSDQGSMTSGIAARYATALFELAKDAKKLPDLEKNLDALSDALNTSDALQELIHSPVYTRDDAGAAVAALAKKMKLNSTVSNTLGLMAAKRRLFALPATIRAVKSMIADHKGEVTAEVTAAKALTAAQEKKLAAELKKSVGKTVKVETTVDESLIGGLIVNVGSKMIDTSIKSKLANLQNAMKEVG